MNELIFFIIFMLFCTLLFEGLPLAKNCLLGGEGHDYSRTHVYTSRVVFPCNSKNNSLLHSLFFMFVSMVTVG